MAQLQYTPQQRMAIEKRGGSILVSAAAGSGKTRVLVERLMGYIENEGKNIDDFLIITYTRAAASELRSRIAREISQRLSKTPTDRHLRRQSALCHKADIGTIHSFCGKILKENAYILDMDSGFRTADETETSILKEKVLNDILDKRYERINEDSDFKYLVDTMGAGRDDSKLIAAILDSYEKLQSLPYPNKWMNNVLHMWQEAGIGDAGDTVWGRFLLEKAKREAEYWLGEMEKALELIYSDEKLGDAYGESFDISVMGIRSMLKAMNEGYNAVSECIVEFPRLGALRKYEDKEKQDKVKYIRDSCKKAMADLNKRFNCTSEDVAEDIKVTFPGVRALFSLLNEFMSEYSAEKRRKNVVDFSDLEHLCLELFIDEEGNVTTLAKDISHRYAEILVDEYQDVNAVQDLIFKSVSRNEKNIFMVGDVKQSIYRFRLADPGIFLEKYNKFKDAEDAAEDEPRKIMLSNNFRSNKGITEAVNLVFSKIMTLELGEMSYTEKEALIAAAEYPDTNLSAVELHILDMESIDSNGEESPSKTALEARFAADRILELVNSGMQIKGEDGTQRAVEFGDFAILMRSMGDKASIYASVLAEKAIPVSIDKTNGFFDTVEISTVLSILSIVDNPRQDIPLISAMTSPIWGFTPDELTDIRMINSEGDFFEALEKAAETNEKCQKFMDDIAKLRVLAPDMPSDRFIWHIYTKLGMLNLMSAMPGGDRRRENLMRLLEYSRKFDAEGYRGFFSFVAQLRKLQETGGGVAGGETSASAVKIMSIHKSKGLEYPVVILADMSKKFNKDDLKRSLLVHSELGVGIKRRDPERRLEYPILPRQAILAKMENELLSEEMRVLYVAMTRAKEKLIMLYTTPKVEQKLEKLSRNNEKIPPIYVLERAQSIGDWVLAALCCTSAHKESMMPEIPGWDIHIRSLKEGLDVPEMATDLKTEVKSTADLNKDLVAEISQNLNFTYQYETNIPSKLTATQIKGRDKDQEAAEDTDYKKPISAFERPSFTKEKKGLTPAEKGTALHLAMQYIDYKKCTDLDGINKEILRLQDKKFISPEQAEAISADKIASIFQSDLGKRIMTSENVYREFKFSILVPAKWYYETASDEEILLQGVVDCFIDDGELTVIDFKTDNVNKYTVKERAEGYRQQLEAYSRALEKITGKRVRKKILYFFTLDMEYEL